MRVVITGGGGFLGRKLAARLLERGALDMPGGTIDELVLFDAVPPPEIVDRRVRVAVGDVADSATVRGLIDGKTGAVFHLAAVVSAGAEAEFDLGYRVNLHGTLAVLEACRALGTAPRLVFTSSAAAYGGDLPPVVQDMTAVTPQTSYGTQKVMGELLVTDYSRKGFVDGRALRLPTIVVRPGKPNRAASGFASSIVREPLQGLEAVCPVAPETEMYLLSPRGAVDAFIRAAELPGESWGPSRALALPGITASMAGIAAAVERAGGKEAAGRIRWERDPAIERIVRTWPGRFDAARARALGFRADDGIDAIVADFIHDELGGRVVR